MKKATVLLALLFISTFGFSQNKISEYDAVSGFNLIVKQDLGSQPIINVDNDPLIDEINKIKTEYLNLKIREIHNGFAKEDLSSLKTKDQVLKAYSAYFKKVMKSDEILMTKTYGNGDLLQHFAIPRATFIDKQSIKANTKKDTKASKTFKKE